jgi:hypothetical protein
MLLARSLSLPRTEPLMVAINSNVSIPFLWPGSVHTPWLPSVNARLLVRGYSSPHDFAGSVEIVRLHAA